MTNSAPRLLRVFLCYASADMTAVRKLYFYLLQRGVDPWLDRISLLPGEILDDEIPKALTASDVIIVCLSKTSINSEGYFQKEIRLALDKAQEKPEEFFIIPAKLEECELPVSIDKYQWVDLFRQGGYKRLMQSLNKRADDVGLAMVQVSEDTKEFLSSSPQFGSELVELKFEQKSETNSKLPSSNIRDLLATADDAYYAAVYDKAIDFYKQALVLDSHNKHAQDQIRKAEFYGSFKGAKPEELMAEALQLYKRSRSFIAINDLSGAKKLLEQAIKVAEKAGVDFTNAKVLLENIQNASRAEESKKKAYQELEMLQWVRAEADLSLAIDLDPTDPIVQELLSHLRSLLRAQNLVKQLNSGFTSSRDSSTIDKEISNIIELTNNTHVLHNLWAHVMEEKLQRTVQSSQLEEVKTPNPKLFISYAHKDESFKDEFVIMFAGLQRRGGIEAWQDRSIEAGKEWFDDIRKAMKECDLAILLVSPDFIASNFILAEELSYLLQRKKEEDLRIIPIIVRSCLWQDEPLLKDLQALPKDGKPVISFSKENGDRDQIWADIGKKIKEIAENL